MKILPLSDLHIRSAYDLASIKFEHVNVLILAGDISEPIAHLPNIFTYLLTMCDHIVYVPGNHEYWGSSMTAVDDQLLSIFTDVNSNYDVPRVHLLGKVIIDGVNFVGATLWTEYRNEDGSYPDPDVLIGDNYRILDYSGNLFTPEYSRSIHLIHRDIIKTNLHESLPNVIVTHHLPTWRHADDRYKDSGTHPFFMSNMDDFIKESGAVLWVHGHTHKAFDSIIGNTRVVANPRGYVQRTGNWENEKFSLKHIIEIPN